jgi:hypothetical protein
MTLYEQTGLCPLELWTTYFIKRNCEYCPMNNGVDIGVGFMTHCNQECKVSIDAESENDLF